MGTATSYIRRNPRDSAKECPRRCVAAGAVLLPLATTLEMNLLILNKEVQAPATDPPTTVSPQTTLTPSSQSATATLSSLSKFILSREISVLPPVIHVSSNEKPAAV